MEIDCWQAADARFEEKMKRATRLRRFTTIEDLIRAEIKTEYNEIVDINIILDHEGQVAYEAFVIGKK